jgi:N-acetylmuramoyl-L-alanine amidase
MAIKKIIIFVFTVLLITAFFVTLLTVANDKNNPPKAFEPPKQILQEKKLPTVIIDAGHGGEDCGAIGTNGALEKDINLRIATELYSILQAEGIPARLTRTDDRLLYDRNTDYLGRKKALDMSARLAIMSEYQNAIFISIHMNSFSQSKYSGLQVYYSENSPESSKLADIVQSLARQSLQPDNDRKTKPSSGNIYLLEKTEHTAILVECGFLSNPAECEKLCSEEYQKRLALVLYNSIVTYFDTCQKIKSNMS